METLGTLQGVAEATQIGEMVLQYLPEAPVEVEMVVVIALIQAHRTVMQTLVVAEVEAMVRHQTHAVATEAQVQSL